MNIGTTGNFSFDFTISLQITLNVISNSPYYGYFYDSEGAITSYTNTSLSYAQYCHANYSPEHKVFFTVIVC